VGAVISVSWQRQGLVVRVTGSDRFLAWPGRGEVVLPPDAVSGATSHPSLSAFPDQERLFGSAGDGLRTLPLVPGQWVFGCRRIHNERFLCAVRGRATPVLVVTARDWYLNGVVVSTPDAARIAEALSSLDDTGEAGRQHLTSSEV
jgi:hypothetical protein